MPLGNPKYVPVDVNFGQVPASTNTFNIGLSYLAKGIERQNKLKDDLVDTKASIQATLNSLPVDESEQDWMDDYAYNIQSQIDYYIDSGDYDTALFKARTLAKTALTDPRVASRMKRYDAWKKEHDAVMNDKNLDDIRKQRWEEENPYTAGLVVDDKDRVNDWHSTYTPLAPINYSSLYEEVKKLVEAEKGSGESAMYLDAKGKLNPNPQESFYGLAFKRGTTFERVSEDRLKKAFDALFASHPEYKAAILQDMDDRRWQYNKASDEDKKAFLGSDIMDANGEFYSPKEYLEHMTQPVLHEMRKNNVFNNIDFGSAWNAKLADDRALAKAKGAAGGGGIEDILSSMLDMSSTSAGPNIEIDLSKQAQGSYNQAQSCIQEMSKLSPAFMASEKAKNLIAEGKYEDLADGFLNSINGTAAQTFNKLNGTPISREDLGKAQAVADLLKNEGKVLNALTTNFNKEDIDAITFSAAVDGNAPLPANNEYTESYTAHKNNLFRYMDNNGKEQTAGAIGLVFQDKNQQSKVVDFLSSRNITPNVYEQYGLKLERNSNGKYELKVSKDSPVLSDVADAAKNAPDRFWSFDHMGVVAYDDFDSTTPYSDTRNYAPGRITDTQRLLALTNFLGKDGFVADKAKRTSDKAYAGNPNAKMVIPVEILPQSDYNQIFLNQFLSSGKIDRATYRIFDKDFQENNMQAFSAAIKHAGNNIWYGQTDEEGTNKELNPDEVRTAMKTIEAALAQGRVKIAPIDAPTNSGYGTAVIVEPKINTKGGYYEDQEPKLYYVDGLLSNQAAQAFAKDPKNLMKNLFRKSRGMNIETKDINGNVIDYNDPNALQEFTLSTEVNDIVRSIYRRKGTKDELTPTQIAQTATGLIYDYYFGTHSPTEVIEKVQAKYGVATPEEAVVILNNLIQDDDVARTYQTVLTTLNEANK